jgi:hypothetical protein
VIRTSPTIGLQFSGRWTFGLNHMKDASDAIFYFSCNCRGENDRFPATFLGMCQDPLTSDASNMFELPEIVCELHLGWFGEC